MGADASIFQGYLTPPKSIIDYQNQYAQADQLRNQNALASLTLQQKGAEVQQGLASQNALQRIAGGWNAGTTMDQRVADLRNSGLPALMTQADTLETQGLARTKTEAEAGKTKAETATTQFNLTQDKRDKAVRDIVSFSTPGDAMSSLAMHVQNGDLDPVKAHAMAQSIPQDPAAFQQWQLTTLKGLLAPKDGLEISKPNVEFKQAGGSLVPVQTNAYAPGGVTQGAATGMAPIPITQSADSIATNATSRANNAATIKKDYVVAGMNPDGTPTGDINTTAQAIADGRLPPPSGMALTNPKNQRILSRVMEINPEYDYTTVTAKKAAATAFTSGSQGNALRSVSTANEHLNQLDQLGDALQNGNIPIVNTIANAYGVQTGQAPAKVFDAVKNVVAQEVVKAIVAGGGSAGERDEAAHAFANSSSPQQLKQTITAYRHVMQAQADNLMAQRRAAGLPDSTLPGYNGGAQGAPAAVPPDIQAILDRHGAK